MLFCMNSKKSCKFCFQIDLGVTKKILNIMLKRLDTNS